MIMDKKADTRWHDFDRGIFQIAERIRRMRCQMIECYVCPFFHSNGWNEKCGFSTSGEDFEKWLTLTDSTDEIWRRV